MSNEERSREEDEVQSFSEKSLPRDLDVSFSRYVYIKTDRIETTFDKLEILLKGYEAHIGRKDAWIAPLGTLATILAAISTTTFKDAFGVSACAWQAVFVIGAFATSFWLLKSIIASIRSVSINHIINELKERSTLDEKGSE